MNWCTYVLLTVVYYARQRLGVTDAFYSSLIVWHTRLSTGVDPSAAVFILQQSFQSTRRKTSLLSLFNFAYWQTLYRLTQRSDTGCRCRWLVTRHVRSWIGWQMCCRFHRHGHTHTHTHTHRLHNKRTAWLTLCNPVGYIIRFVLTCINFTANKLCGLHVTGIMHSAYTNLSDPALKSYN